jgi:hypothetical protein
VSAPAVVAPAPRTRGAARPVPRRQPDAHARHLRLVTTAPRLRRRPRPIVLVGAATTALVLALVVVHVLLAQSQVRLDRLNAQVGSAQQRYEQALLQHSELAAPSRIIARAGQLGLVAPAQPAVAVPVPAPGAATAQPTRRSP